MKTSTFVTGYCSYIDTLLDFVNNENLRQSYARWWNTIGGCRLIHKYTL